MSPGDEHASGHGAPNLWALLDRLPRDLWPALLRAKPMTQYPMERQGMLG